MPKFQVTVSDEAGHKLYDESIEAIGPMEACAKAVADAKTADVAETEEQMDGGLVPALHDGHVTVDAILPCAADGLRKHRLFRRC